MTFEEKLEVAELLDEMGVDIIEAGFPIASEGDFEAVHGDRQARQERGRRRPRRAPAPKDIDRCGEAVQAGQAPRIHTFISTSPVHMKYKLQKEPDEVLEMVIAHGDARAQPRRRRRVVGRGRAPAPSIDFLCRCVEAAIKAGATTINIPDTVGYAMPEEYFAAVQDGARARAERRQGDLLGALPQRSRPGGGQLAGRRRGRRAADRMHHQRHRRARRQRGAGRNRDGDQDAQRRAAVLRPASTPRC